MILVTGASGFVGGALCRTLRALGNEVVAAVRRNGNAGQFAVGNLDAYTNWIGALEGCDTVIHLAARVHVMSDKNRNPLHAYRDVNVDGTLNLARQAAMCGVKRFVFVSSVKVNGDVTAGSAFRETDAPTPKDPYGISKFEAECALRQLASETGLELVIVRPPLVYGPGVKANFLSLMRLVSLGIPLPFANVRNYRSMVALDNLINLLVLCAKHPNAPGEVFMVSDGEDIGIADLIRMLASSMGKRALLIPMPVEMILSTAKLVGKEAVFERLLGSLQVDISHTRETLGWAPVISAQDAIPRTVAHFLAVENGKRK